MILLQATQGDLVGFYSRSNSYASRSRHPDRERKHKLYVRKRKLGLMHHQRRLGPQVYSEHAYVVFICNASKQPLNSIQS